MAHDDEPRHSELPVGNWTDSDSDVPTNPNRMVQLLPPPNHPRFEVKENEICFKSACMTIPLRRLSKETREDCGAVATLAWAKIRDAAMVSSSIEVASKFNLAFDQAQAWSDFADGKGSSISI